MPHTRRLIAAAVALACSAPLALAPATWAGDGQFATSQDLPVTEPTALAAGDFNTDGKPDLAVVSEATRQIQIYLQDSEGRLTSGPQIAIGQSPRVLAVGDFDRDGNDDLAVGDVRDQDVKVRLGVGNGTFTNAPDVSIGREPQSLVTGDFNGDGKDDLAVATKNRAGPPHRIAVRIGEGDGKFAATGDAADGAAVLAVADFNSDSNEDLAYGGLPTYPAGGLALGRGAATFAPGSDVPLPQQASFRRGWAVGDFNNDSNPDLVAGLAHDLTAVRLGGGDRTFAGKTEVLTPGTPAAVAVGDFNSDGNEDFVVTDTGGSKSVRVRLGDGTGSFASAPDVPVGAAPVDVAVADFDSDGNDDLAVANSDGSISVRRGTGRAVLDGNLLVNGGFEGPTPTGHIRPPLTITGWELQGRVSAARYGAPSHAFVPARIASPRYGTGGGRMLAGGDSSTTNGITGVSQVVDVAANAQAIDSGRTTANLSAYLGGAQQFEDGFTARADFLNGNTTVGSFQIGPVTAADRNRQTTLLRRAGSSPVPAGTRRIRVTLTSNDADKQQSSALADNAKLTLTTAPAATGGTGGNDTPRPTTPKKTFGSLTLVTLKPSSRRLKPGQQLRVAVRNANGFAVGGRLGRRRLTVLAQSTTTVKVKLSARQRRALQRKHSASVRLTALITDPAGQTRRVSRTARLRSK